MHNSNTLERRKKACPQQNKEAKRVLRAEDTLMIFNGFTFSRK
jgi:hypothetical protein